jgi:hypothetical protein
MVYNGHDMKLRALLELGDMGAVDREIAQLERTASAISKPLFGWHVRSCRAMRALHAGDAREADRWMRDALELGSKADRTLAQRSAQGQAALCTGSWERQLPATIEAEAAVDLEETATPRSLRSYGGRAAQDPCRGVITIRDHRCPRGSWRV